MRSVRFLRVIPVLFIAVACVTTQARPQETARPKKLGITGKLTRVIAIGAETSGWSIELKREIAVEGKKMRSIEVSGPSEEFERLKNQRVRAIGTLAHHTGMERGDYIVLEVTSIKPAP